MEQMNLLIVDDEEKITEVVSSYFKAKDFEVFVAHNGAEAFHILEKQMIALILLDLMLPGESGEDICLKIRQSSRVPIIMLTAKIGEEDMLYGLDIGADDYVTKPFSLKTLHARVNAVLRRSGQEQALCSNIASFLDGDLVIYFDSHIVQKKGKDAELTPNEFKLLATFVKFPNKVFTREELIESTFGYEYEGYDRTIDSHIRNIRSKIEDNTRAPLYIKTVHGVGYLFGGGSLEATT